MKFLLDIGQDTVHVGWKAHALKHAAVQAGGAGNLAASAAQGRTSGESPGKEAALHCRKRLRSSPTGLLSSDFSAGMLSWPALRLFLPPPLVAEPELVDLT